MTATVPAIYKNLQILQNMVTLPKQMAGATSFAIELPRDLMIQEPNVTYNLTINNRQLPNWLKFDADNFTLGGNPPLGRRQYIIQLTVLTSNGTTKTVSMPLIFKGNTPPQVTGSLEVLPHAQLGQDYAHFFNVSALFDDIDIYDPDFNDTLTYSMVNLPKWLSFEAVNTSFYRLYGKPNRGNMKLAGDTIYTMSLKAEDLAQTSATIPVSVQIDGSFTIANALSATAAAGTGIAATTLIYRYRGLVLNVLQKTVYLKNIKKIMNQNKIKQSIGGYTSGPFEPIKLETQVGKVGMVQMFKPQDKKWYQIFKSRYVPLSGGARFIDGIRYHDEKNVVECVGKAPKAEGSYIIQVRDHSDIVKENIKLDIKNNPLTECTEEAYTSCESTKHEDVMIAMPNVQNPTDGDMILNMNRKLNWPIFDLYSVTNRPKVQV